MTSPNSHRSHQLAWLCSIILHLLLLSTVLITVRQRLGGTVEQAGRDVSVALVKLENDERRFFDEEGELAEGSPDAIDSSAYLPAAEELAVDVSGDLPDLKGSGSLRVGDVGPSLAESTAPGRDRFGESGSTITSVFGVRGEGSRFVYVFDRSGSMGGHGGTPIRAAKSELLASLKDLKPHHQFQIIFYDDGIELFNPLGGKAKLAWADEAGRNLATAFVRGIDPDGGTDHVQPLNLALDMAPDVIFFLTDADEPPLTTTQLKSIRRRNSGTTIHAIEFGVGPQSSSNNFLARLAADNGGQYRYINIRQLPAR
jgi:hypothetical protein